MLENWALGMGLVTTSFFSAIGGVLLLAYLPGKSRSNQGSIFAELGIGTAMLFDGDILVDSSPGARTLLASSHTRGSPWIKLMSYLAPHFPELDTHLIRLPHEGSITLTSVKGGPEALLLQLELRGGLTRLTLVDPEKDERLPAQDPIAHRAQSEELEILRLTMAKAPMLVWRERADGEIIWANTAYLLRVGETLPHGQDLTWPLPRLFGRTASAQGASGQRQRITLQGGKEAWYELIGSSEGEGRLLYAVPADAAVLAERSLSEFMQTLTKTFAHLRVGLAIFDHQRQLQLFNPALLDLTDLPVDFLSLKPSLLSVLDAMRDRNMIPEPKDYRGWRRQLVELEKAAASGLYEETWSLPSGQTYRVIGRPHPNGALALMIEDISNEMLRTRRYRADIELGQAVIDEVDEAMAVFSNAGQLVMSNSAYAKLWNHDPSTAVNEGCLRVLCGHWRSQSAPSTVWGEVEIYASNPGDRTAWTAEARLLDGRLLDCRFAPLTGGATLTAFRISDSTGATKPAIAEDADKRRALG